jgi:putative addiction module component (TIGR02574 family)
MPPTLREQIAALSREEKLELMHDLWDELHAEADDEPVSDELKELLDRRKAEHEANPGSGLTLEQVIANARARYGR